MKKFKIFFRLFMALTVLIMCFYIYARFIEPELLVINEEETSSYFTCEELNGVRVLQFSDTHLSEYFDIIDLKELVDKINEQKADIVFFTGDLIDHYFSFSFIEEVSNVSEVLKEIEAPLGKYAVFGNHDYGGGAVRVYEEIMAEGGFILLVNSKYTLDEYKLNIIGIDDALFGEPDIEGAMENVNKDYFNLLISHEPDVIDNYLDYDIDLCLSGHSHGGQVNVPFFTQKMLPLLGEKYISGYFEFENTRNTKLYVNKGIGVSQIPLRFMSIPEISIFKITKPN